MANADASGMLFASLLRALEAQRGDGDHEGHVNGLDTEEMRKELQEWWRTMPFATPSSKNKADYKRIYRQLVQMTHEQAPGIHKSSMAFAVEQLIEADWPRDQAAVESRERFQASVLQIIHLMLSGGSPPAVTALSLIRQLRQAGDAKTVETEDKKPRTMAEKLAQMRERRSTMVKDGSIAKLNKLTTPASDSIETPLPLAAASAVKNDDAVHLFTIETRSELKEKLRGLQNRLDALLLETKLAWMKCFASEDQAEYSDSSSAAATQLVEEGEALASHLLDAFTMARTSKCAIGEYKALVATCEHEMEAFQALVSSMASAPSPVKKKEGKTKHPVQVGNTAEPLEDAVPRPQPVEFDLPSMKAYYAKAAPSYTAYLPKKAMNRR